MPAANKLLSAPAAAMRSLMVLQALSLMLARQLGDYLLAAAAAAAALVCPPRWRRCTQPSMVLLYTNCRGGYHSDLRRTWHSLQRTVEAGEPGLGWRTMPRFTLFFDDQVNYPAECCRASLGFVVAAGVADPQRVAAEWRSHPLVSHRHGLMVGVLPQGACLTADLPHCGPLSYIICLVRALYELRSEVRATGVRGKVPGLVELRDPTCHRLSFLLPLEGRSDMLPF